jgi:aspartyl-tRNA(Asn)/glutamyl-tRNA(Gln) amidotransferase subunit B
MRVKETSDDYRYFPEPDLPPLRIDRAWLDEIASGLPELPAARRARYRDGFGLSGYDASVLVADADAGTLFEATLAADATLPPKRVANWVTGEYLRLRKGETDTGGGAGVPAEELAALVRLVEDGQLSGTNAKEVLARLMLTGQPVASIVEEAGFQRISDEGALSAAVREVVEANPEAVADVRAGKAQAIGFLVGQVMKATRGQADASVVRALITAAVEDGGRA